MSINTDHGYYARLIHFAKQHASLKTIEGIESSLVHASTCIPFTFAALAAMKATSDRKMYDYSPPSWGELASLAATVIGGIAIGMMGVIQFNKRVKSPFIKHQIENAVNSSKKCSKTMLVFKTSVDPFGAFSTHLEVSRYERFAKTHSIKILSAETEIPLQVKMNTIKDEFDLIVIKGFANANSICLAPGILLTEESKHMHRWFKKHLKENGIIAIEGSNTGEGKENIAQALSKVCKGASVYASSSNVDVIDGIEYDEEGVPSYSNGCWSKGENMTRLYQDGRLTVA